MSGGRDPAGLLRPAPVIWLSAAVAGHQSHRKLTWHGQTTDCVDRHGGCRLGITGYEWIAWYKRRVGKRIGSTPHR